MFPKKIAEQIRQEVSPLETGLHIYTMPEGGKSYFYYVQASKKILLISKAYQRRKSADNAAQRLYQKKLATAYQSVTDKHKKQKHHFQLLDGNKKAMANSHAFASLADAKLAIQGLSTYLTDQSGTPEGAKATPVVQDPVRSRFRLDFYHDQGEQGLRGQIEYVPSRDKKEFTGLDMATIHAFLSEQLEKDIPAVTKKETAVVAKKQLQPSLAVALQELGDDSPDTSFPLGTPLEISLSVADTKRAESAASIYLKSLGSSTKILLTEEKISATDVPVRIPVYTQELKPGFYQVIATLKSEQKTKGAQRSQSQASQVVQLY